jgi:hypothetical protein
MATICVGQRVENLEGSPTVVGPLLYRKHLNSEDKVEDLLLLTTQEWRLGDIATSEHSTDTHAQLMVFLGLQT